MRKRSGANFEELLNKQWNILTKNQQNQIHNQFRKTQQRNGGISFYDLVHIIQGLSIPISNLRKDKLNKQFANKEIRILDEHVLMSHAATLKKQRQESYRDVVAEENQYLDAFVALGGKADKTGFVRKAELIQTIKRQFQLTFDIESMIDAQGESLDYSIFCSIFEQDLERGDGRLASSASQRSIRSSDSIRSLVLEEKNFHKWISQYENEDYS